MQNPNTISAAERQDLVAYLDGELDEAGARTVVAKLSQSAAYRSEMEQLQKAWDLLDYLPRPKAHKSFTQQTIHKLSTVRLTTSLRVRRWQRLGTAGWAAAVLACGLGSFYLMFQRTPARPPEPSLEDLRVLDQREFWPHYQRIDSVDFLRELDQPDLFGEDS